MQLKTTEPARAAPTLAAKVAALQQPASYPEPTTRVETIETHMSFVFLTDRFAYKLKKPVRNELLDFSTLELRAWCCGEELRLNRRLAAQTYLDVVPLTDDGAVLRAGGDGVPVEWLVKMHRLPAALLLDQVVREGTLMPHAITEAAAHLAAFYRDAPPVAVTFDFYRDRFAADIAAARHALRSYAAPHLGVRADRVCDALEQQLPQLAEQLEARVLGNRIVEGHGDLRPEHIHVGDPPQIIDCVEFRRDLRLVDPVEELAQLLVECEMLDDVATGAAFLSAYTFIAADFVPNELLDFYRAMRAMTRARLSILHLRDEHVRDPDRWPVQAGRYVEIGAQALGL